MAIISQETTNNTDSLPNYVKEGQSSIIGNQTGIFGMQGWICPKCGRVYSPHTSMCSYCRNDNYTTTISTDFRDNNEQFWEK